jgi:hypothetical protein
MSSRIDVELTSTRDDGTWTWRAAGARQPKGVLRASLLPPDPKLGQVLRVEVETGLDGLEVVAVVPPKKTTRSEPERLQLLGSGKADEPLVTTVLAPKGRGGDRRERRDGPRRDGDSRDRGRRDRPTGDARGPQGARGPRPERSGEARGPRSGGPDTRSAGTREGARKPRTSRPAPPPRPKAKRLRPGRTHRNEVLAALPPEQRPVAEQVLRGGIPAVRQGIEKQNETARAEGRPEVKADALVTLAEQLLPALRTAEWLDRAEAALADIDELDLRDLRSVVVAADDSARDEASRALATDLRAQLTRRVDQAHTEWLAEIGSALDEGRVVRALKLSSRPPKAGAPLPAELATRLGDAASAALTAEAGRDRWSTVLDALSFSPVHRTVKPAGVPTEPGEELLTIVRSFATRLPEVAQAFGIDPSTSPPPPRRPRRPVPPKPPKPARAKAPAAEAAPPAEAPAEPAPGGAPVAEAPTEPAPAEAPVAEAPAEVAEPEAPATESAPTETPADPPSAEATPAPEAPADAGPPDSGAAPAHGD